MTRETAAAQLSLDLFGTSALTPADFPPPGVMRIPMQEPPPDGSGDSEARDAPDTQPPAEHATPIASAFHLAGDRGLARGWKQRAIDNIEAIRLLKEIESAHRPATSGEQAKLIRFCAFSSTDLAQNIFRRAGRFGSGWQELGESLEDIVSPAERAGLARATQYAHYTPEYQVHALWRAVTGFGFAGGRVLEPGCGSGLFIALEPEALRGRCRFTGIEADPITARIARLLYPESNIHAEDFTRARLSGRYDLAIGNPPFSDRTVRIPEAGCKLSFSLHDAFIARSLAQLRPGGLAAFVVSRWTMDKRDATARAWFRTYADLIAAIRLPAGAMRADAGTDVVVDLLFFQAREPGAEAGGPEFLEVADVLPALDEQTPAAAVNRYFVDRPAMVLGRHERTASAFGPVYTCTGPLGPALEATLAERIAGLPKAIHTPPSLPGSLSFEEGSAGPLGNTAVGNPAGGKTLREGSYVVLCNRLHQVDNGVPVEVAIRSGKGRGSPGATPK